MPKMVGEIITAYESHIGEDVKSYVTPREPGMVLGKNGNVEPTDLDKYR
jgi:hypothetical protein